MTADTLSAEEREALFAWADDYLDTMGTSAAIYNDANLSGRANRFASLLHLARLATPELIQLGETAVKWGEVEYQTAKGDHALFTAARTYAASRDGGGGDE